MALRRRIGKRPGYKAMNESLLRALTEIFSAATVGSIGLSIVASIAGARSARLRIRQGEADELIKNAVREAKKEKERAKAPVA
jgi:hypothetical protein